MSKIVHAPVIPHTCSPGWTWTPIPAGHWLEDFGKGGCTGTPPSPSDYPRGTVWECDCGRTWVVYRVDHGIVHFHQEGRFARWRRERRTTA